MERTPHFETLGWGQSRPPESPETELIRAILIRALVDNLGPSRSVTQSEHREARNWFDSTDDDEWGFVWCCEQLHLCPAQIYQRARNLALVADHYEPQVWFRLAAAILS